MSLRDWMKVITEHKSGAVGLPPATASVAGGRGDTAQDQSGAVISGLNFKTAIDAHMKWKIRLEQYIQGDCTEELHVDSVSRDDLCVLGQWIHGPGGRRFGNNREFQEMKLEHARFHLAAGDILACAVAGDTEGALQKLRSGDYVRASERVKLKLARLYVQVTEDK